MRLSQILAALAATTLLLLVVALVVLTFDGCAPTEPQTRDTEASSEERSAARVGGASRASPEVAVPTRRTARPRAAGVSREAWTAALLALTTPTRAGAARVDACTVERGTCLLEVLDADEGIAFTFLTADGQEAGEGTAVEDVEGAPVDALRLRALGWRAGDAPPCAWRSGEGASCGPEAYVLEELHAPDPREVTGARPLRRAP